MSRTANVLVVDDERHIRELVRLGLGIDGFDVQEAGGGREGLEMIRAQPPDLLILDVMMPDMDGFELARRIRSGDAPGSAVPIIFLTARSDVADKVAGFKIGADDYLTKPFSVEELAVRVRAVLRRVGHSGAPGSDLLVVGNLSLDRQARLVHVGSDEVTLTRTEYLLLELLMRNSDRVLTRQEILLEIWGYESSPSSTVLDTYVSYLRKKLGGDDHARIQTVRGVGFVIRT